MSNFLMYHHLGMGDHLITNGLVRKLYKDKNTDEFQIICKNMYNENVSFMYRDLKKLRTVPVSDDNMANAYFNSFNGDKIKHFIVDEATKKNEYGEDYLYTSLGYSKEDRYNSFYFERDHIKETELYNLISPSKPYIFIHDDPQRNYIIKTNTNMSIIRSSLYPSASIFHFTRIIEEAEELHFINGSFQALIDGMLNQLNNKKAYLHETYIKKIFPMSEKYIKHYTKRGIIIV